MHVVLSSISAKYDPVQLHNKLKITNSGIAFEIFDEA